MTSAQVAQRIRQMLEQDGKEFLLYRGQLKWVRLKAGAETFCFACQGTIHAGEIMELLCCEVGFRKICLQVFCLFCARRLKREGLAMALLNGGE